MKKIATWEELVASDLPLSYDEARTEAVTNCDYATVVKPTDGKMRLNFGLIINSIVHEVEGEVMLVVQEGQMVVTPPEPDGFTQTPYPNTVGTLPHYRMAVSLGLTGNHHDTNTHSVLVPISKLDQIEFSTDPEPLLAWEKELLDNS